MSGPGVDSRLLNMTRICSGGATADEKAGSSDKAMGQPRANGARFLRHPFATKPGFTAGALGAILLLLLLSARLAFRADASFVYFDGRKVGTECAIRQRFGVPCPACGLTRSVILSLHGDIGRASRLNPAGPLAVLGFAAFSLALLYVSYRQQTRLPDAGEDLQKIVRRASLAYGAVLVVVALGHWALALANVWPGGS